MINDSRASRWHSQVEFKQGKFVLRDNSTNGSFVIPEVGQAQRVHREEFLLSGSGTISLSGKRDAEGGSAIFSRCESD